MENYAAASTRDLNQYVKFIVLLMTVLRPSLWNHYKGPGLISLEIPYTPKQQEKNENEPRII